MQTTTERNAPATGGPADVDESLTGLQPDTTYHYRIVATDVSGRGTSTGPDETVTTGLQLNGTAGTSVSGVVVSGSGCPDAVATIHWGDGTQSTGQITCGDFFSISGSHTYANPRHYSIFVTLSTGAGLRRRGADLRQQVDARGDDGRRTRSTTPTASPPSARSARR